MRRKWITLAFIFEEEKKNIGCTFQNLLSRLGQILQRDEDLQTNELTLFFVICLLPAGMIFLSNEFLTRVLILSSWLNYHNLREIFAM